MAIGAQHRSIIAARSFIGNGDVSIWVSSGTKIPKQTNKQFSLGFQLDESPLPLGYVDYIETIFGVRMKENPISHINSHTSQCP